MTILSIWNRTIACVTAWSYASILNAPKGSIPIQMLKTLISNIARGGLIAPVELTGSENTGVPRGRRVGWFKPFRIFGIFLSCVFAKYTVQALLLYLLNLKFCTENVKNCIAHFASALGRLCPQAPYRGFAAGPYWGITVLRPPDPAPTT